jgi:hypothetical protein
LPRPAVKQTVATYRWIRASISSKPYPVQEKQEPPVDPQVDAAARCIAWIDTDGLDFLNEFRVDPTTGAVARKPAMTLMTQLAFPATRGMIDRWGWPAARLATLYVVVTHPLATLQSLYQLANFLHIPPWTTGGTFASTP